MTTTGRWTPAECEILQAQFGKLTYKQIGELLDRNWISVRHQASAQRLTQGSNLGRKFSVDHAFFANPSPLNSYWAGFIAADGCVRGKRLTVKLSDKDADHLARLASDIGYTGPIWHASGMCCLQICCEAFVEDLAKHFNITPRKSLTLQPPGISTPAEVRAFITGVIDGDGSITENRYRQYTRTRISIYGTAELLHWIKGYFDQWSPGGARQASNVRQIPGKNLHAYSVTASRAVRVGNALREVDVPRLRRKWDRLPEG